jgi:undecaprenyl-diphosphatase
MTIFQSIILGIIEGLTEFLPISSTAHMKFANPLLGVAASPFNDMFEVVIQLAAILAVVVIFAKKFFNFKHIGFYIKLLIAVVPALLVGALLKKHIDAALGNLIFIAIVMVVGGVILLFVDKWFTNQTIVAEEQITNKSAFVIGCFQVLAVIFPGLSRSAATIIGGMSQKLTRNLAAEFSFFLAVPTMLAASVKSLYDVYKDTPEVLNTSNLTVLLVGGIVSFVVAIIAIKFFMDVLKKYGFKVWGYYRIVAGLIMLALLLTGVIK